MFVEDKKMYHIHTLNKYDELWIPGNTIVVDDNFKSYFRQMDEITMAGVLNQNEEIVSMDFVMRNFLQREKVSKKEYKDLIEHAANILHDMTIKEREGILEWVRQQSYSHLPSRTSSIWLTDEKNLEFWKEQLNREQEVFIVSATGNIFKSADRLLPSRVTTQPEMIEQSKAYWEANDLKDDDNIEYLFQGKLKLLRRFK